MWWDRTKAAQGYRRPVIAKLLNRPQACSLDSTIQCTTATTPACLHPTADGSANQFFLKIAKFYNACDGNFV